MRMTPLVLILGGLLVFWSSVFSLVFLPALTFNPEPSDIWRPMTPEEKAGYKVYAENGCSYCHTQFVRPEDWGPVAERISQAGDYVGRSPVLLGTERTGPDLADEGGIHTDDWHKAHFTNPRNTSPYSVMPAWEFLGEEKIRLLTRFVQFEGMKDADRRMARQRTWRERAIRAYERGSDANTQWLHAQIPEQWRNMPNPYPATDAALMRGKKMYQQFCIGCHGPVGDGQGAAARYLNPPPYDFTVLRRNLAEGKYLGGIIYYQVMNGVTGTAMPFWKKHLESAKIWHLANYIGKSFVGYTDADIPPEGVDASYEPEWKNPTTPPDDKGFSHGRGFR